MHTGITSLGLHWLGDEDNATILSTPISLSFQPQGPCRRQRLGLTKEEEKNRKERKLTFYSSREVKGRSQCGSGSGSELGKYGCVDAAVKFLALRQHFMGISTPPGTNWEKWGVNTVCTCPEVHDICAERAARLLWCITFYLVKVFLETVTVIII